MSSNELAEDRETVAALDAAVARFKALLGSDDGDALLHAWMEVTEAILHCLFRAARLRRENEEQIADIAALTLENVRLREQVRRLTDQHGTFPYLGYKSELKGL